MLMGLSWKYDLKVWKYYTYFILVDQTERATKRNRQHWCWWIWICFSRLGSFQFLTWSKVWLVLIELALCLRLDWVYFLNGWFSDSAEMFLRLSSFKTWWAVLLSLLWIGPKVTWVWYFQIGLIWVLLMSLFKWSGLVFGLGCCTWAEFKESKVSPVYLMNQVGDPWKNLLQKISK